MNINTKAQTAKKRSNHTQAVEAGIIKWKLIVHIVLILLSAFIFAAGVYMKKTYPNEHLEQLFFYITNGGHATGPSVVIESLLFIIPVALLITAALILMQYDFFHTKFVVGKKNGKDGVQIWPIRHRALFTTVMCVVMIVLGLWLSGSFEYVTSQTTTSDFIEKEYVHPQDVTIKAPAHKRNLLVIEIESFETSMFTKQQGGIWDHEVIPEMYELLFDKDAVFFASDNKVKGVLNGFGSTWTTASQIANTSGVPFKVPAEQNNSYKSDNFMRGAYTLGDVLYDNGYRNVLVTCSRANFGGVREYFTKHGQYEIIDADNVDDYELDLPESQYNEWGFSDAAAMHFAEQIMTRIDAEGIQPWHVFISTIDTHFVGYLYDPDEENGYPGSETKFERQLENAYATTSRTVSELIRWVQAQPFYEDTTIVIFGDHLNMIATFCKDKYEKDRGRYNLIFNSMASTDKLKNRQFTAYDFYPTMLAAAGFEIEGNRLGMGTNLFSSEKTLAEQYGMNYMNSQLMLRSEFYIDELIGRDDYEWLEEKAKREGAE